MALTPLAVLLINVNGFLVCPWTDDRTDLGDGPPSGHVLLARTRIERCSGLHLEHGDLWIVPFIYGVWAKHGRGSDAIDAGLRIMLLVILAQGTFAANERIRADVMERLSAGTVGISLLAMTTLRKRIPRSFRRVHGPRSEIGLSTALWLMLSLAYLPAVFKAGRTPWMPIGLALILPFLSLEASFLLPWIITTIALPYLVLGASATRRW